MDRYVIRNYGSSRNLPDGKGSYVFMERDSARETNDEELAKLFASYPEVHVAERGGDALPAPPVSVPPVGPSPPGDEDEEPEDGDQIDSGEDGASQGEDENDQAAEVDYSSLLVADLLTIATERNIKTTGLLKADLVEALIQSDVRKEDELSLSAELPIGQPVKYEDEEEEYVISAVPEVVDGEFTVKNSDGKEFLVKADQFTAIN